MGAVFFVSEFFLGGENDKLFGCQREAENRREVCFIVGRDKAMRAGHWLAFKKHNNAQVSEIHTEK